MTYHTLKCPHCKNVVNRATGSPSYIGNPFLKCPWCGGVYVDSFTQEWATKSPFQRTKFLIDKPLSGAFLSIIAIAGLLAMAEVDVLIALIVGIVGAVLIFVGWTFARKSSIQEMIDMSIERTKSAKYVELLIQAGFKIYPIQGVEIGNILDEEDSPLKEDIKTETDSLRLEMDNKTKKCFCCGNELKENEQTCSKCGAVIPVEIDSIVYERNRKALKWSAIVGLVVGFFTTILFGSIDPNSYLFLIGILLGVGSAYLTSVCFDKYYKNQDTSTTNKSILSKNTLSREEKWLAQEKIDKMILNRGDTLANQMITAISGINAMWDRDTYLDKENNNAEFRSKLYLLAITPELFLANYYLFKAGNHDDIKDSIYTERPYLVLETLIKMGLFIFETKNNLYILKEIIDGDKEEYYQSKALAQRILNEELR